jgi:hypothetical protein
MAAQRVASRVVLSSTELVGTHLTNAVLRKGDNVTTRRQQA